MNFVQIFKLCARKQFSFINQCYTCTTKLLAMPSFAVGLVKFLFRGFTLDHLIFDNLYQALSVKIIIKNEWADTNTANCFPLSSRLIINLNVFLNTRKSLFVG